MYIAAQGEVSNFMYINHDLRQRNVHFKNLIIVNGALWRGRILNKAMSRRCVHS
jgi:hypothetical protein